MEPPTSHIQLLISISAAGLLRLRLLKLVKYSDMHSDVWIFGAMESTILLGAIVCEKCHSMLHWCPRRTVHAIPHHYYSISSDFSPRISRDLGIKSIYEKTKQQHERQTLSWMAGEEKREGETQIENKHPISGSCWSDQSQNAKLYFTFISFCFVVSSKSRKHKSFGIYSRWKLKEKVFLHFILKWIKFLDVVEHRKVLKLWAVWSSIWDLINNINGK